MIKYDINDCLRERILLLDGGLGTMIQPYGLEEGDFRGDRFAAWPSQLKGCNDLLALTRADVIREIHEKYLEAGADIITTDSFSANAVSLADYGLEAYAREIACASARIAREAADRFTARNPSKPRFVTGSVGPTNRSASIASDMQNPEARSIRFEELEAAYCEQVMGLLEGGVDLLQLETCFDTLNAKAAIRAMERCFERAGRRVPVIVSGTLTASGRMLAGQTVEAFYASVAHVGPLAVGLNCSFGAKALLPHLERLAAVAECRVAVYPNAGLPNVMGGYDETPAMFAADIEEYLRRGLVNIVGGCCGTTPEHIFELQKIVSRYAPRPLKQRARKTVLAGLETLEITPERNFVNVGERTNVAGSAKFARLIREERLDEALAVARAQVEAGAQVIDVCMDDGMIDAPRMMRRFLNLIASEAEIARVPVMIDSSKWEVLEEGLKVLQGKSIVNSISLKEGEERFLERARSIRNYGAAAVVMLFDERGQAETYERKIEVAERAYRLLRGIGFPAEDIVFDPNILAVATGMPAHDRHGVDFIEATRWIKQNLPGVKVSGGVSNLSFAFRGNGRVREAMHAAFLYHAIAAGMDMGIVNPQTLTVYDTVEPELLQRVEDVLLCRRADASERLIEYAATCQAGSDGAKASGAAAENWRTGSLEERIGYAMRKGVADHIGEDALEGLGQLGSPMAVIEGLLMPAMEQVGRLFGEGKMFLPQVVKTARVMKRAVEALTPYIEQGATRSETGRVVVATVKGDVHDIGKNIVSVVMSCNGYGVDDLGVMVEPQRIVDEAARTNPVAVCLSGLITPSLDEMIRVCRLMQERGLKIPVIIGGATTSRLHTAVKIAPVYDGPVIHSANANENCTILARLTGADRETYLREVASGQAALREEYAAEERKRQLKSFDEARRERRNKPAAEVLRPQHTGCLVIPEYDVEDAARLIDWNFFYTAWGLKGRVPELFDDPERGAEARKLRDDAQAMLQRIAAEKWLTLQGVVGIFPAVSEGDDIVVTDSKGRTVRLPMLRSQRAGERSRSAADLLVDSGEGVSDWIGCFAVTAGVGLEVQKERFRAAGDDYNAIMVKLLADRLTEAFAERMHTFVRREMWGYAPEEHLTPEQTIRGLYRGCRMAFGYPATPDHSLKREVFDLLHVQQTTAMHLTENWMIEPGETLCGLVFSDGDYFSVGPIDGQQLSDYARRRAMTPDEVKKLIPKNLL